MLSLTFRLPFPVLMLILTGRLLHGQQNVLRSTDDGHVVEQVVVNASDLKSFSNAKRAALGFLRQYENERSVLWLTIAPDEEAARRTVGRSRVHGLGYDRTMEDIRSSGFPRGPIARMFGMSGAAVLTYRNGDQLRSEIVAGRQAPSVINRGSTRFEVLHLRLDRVPGSPPESPSYNLQVFARAFPTPSASATADLARTFQGLTNATVFLSVRTDAWFFDNFEYPDVVPWVEIRTLPSSLDYLRQGQVSCLAGRDRLTCNGGNFEP